MGTVASNPMKAETAGTNFSHGKNTAFRQGFIAETPAVNPHTSLVVAPLVRLLWAYKPSTDRDWYSASGGFTPFLLTAFLLVQYQYKFDLSTTNATEQNERFSTHFDHQFDQSRGFF